MSYPQTSGSQRSDRWRLSPVLLVLAIACAGCAQWSADRETGGTASLLPPPSKSLDSVGIETVLVRFADDRSTQLDSMWGMVDETIFDIQFRELLDKNGLRAGLLIGELPKVLREQIDETAHDQNTDAMEHAGLVADADNKMRKLTCRAGRRKDLIVRREVNDPLTVLTTMDKVVSGETYERPAVLFDLRARPHGDGRATVELTPEIQHGDQRQSYVSTESGFRPELTRAQKSWPELKLSVKLSPSQILVVSGTQPTKALGNAFFKTRLADGSHENVVLLVRLAETQLDDLFAPDQIEQANAMAER